MKEYEKIKWSLVYLDNFDREMPPQTEIRGIGLESSIFYLWQYTLSEGITKKGDKSFSEFYIEYEVDDKFLFSSKIDLRFSYSNIYIDPFEYSTLKILRTFIYGGQDTIENREDYSIDGQVLLELIAKYHYLTIEKIISKGEKTSIFDSSQDLLEYFSGFNNKVKLIKILKERTTHD